MGKLFQISDLTKLKEKPPIFLIKKSHALGGTLITLFFLSIKVPANNKIADDRRLRGPVLHDPVVII